MSVVTLIPIDSYLNTSEIYTEALLYKTSKI